MHKIGRQNIKHAFIERVYNCMKKEAVKQIGVRIPYSLWLKLSDEAKRREETVSDVVREACELLFNISSPGLCPSCHTQNNPEARYCSNCASPLIEETKDEEKVRYEDLLRRLEKIEQRYRNSK